MYKRLLNLAFVHSDYLNVDPLQIANIKDYGWGLKITDFYGTKYLILILLFAEKNKKLHNFGLWIQSIKEICIWRSIKNMNCKLMAFVFKVLYK